MKKVFADFRRHHIIFLLILGAIFLFRLPSLFEPFWYGDEGIFAAVGRNLNFGGTLYQTAWDNKPPMIYLTYAAIFKTFGVSMFWLRLVTLVVALVTAAAIYEIAQKVLGEKRALLATGIFGVLSSLRIIEGNLALTEIFMILPISLAFLVAIKRNFDYLSLFAAGLLFALGSLYKQVGALEAAALGIFLFVYTKRFLEFVKKGFVLTLGFLVPYLFFILYFAQKNLVGEYIFAAYTYYQIYLNESPQYQIFINILKFMPIVASIAFAIYQKKKGQVSLLNLFFLWGAFSFLGSFFSGRTYGHYLVQGVPALSLLLASIPRKIDFRRSFVVFLVFFALPLLLLFKFLFADYGVVELRTQVKYWKNFFSFASDGRTLSQYNDSYDSNVNKIMALDNFIRSREARGKTVYVWGDIAWLYAISDLNNPSRYVTSFHVFGVPGGREEVINNLRENPPVYIILAPSSIGYFDELEKLLATSYTHTSTVEDSRIFQRKD
ncbi:MAG: glycosyltransferase family 39 protein [Candidatus Curtissbacteria bacterium]|nr:glycosyltransferase family 39 protein [Candidatus Curtissbacteria bacterium]